MAGGAGVRAGRPPKGRARLTRRAILDAALVLVDEHGMAALSMRRLARELDVDPMSIYHHLPNKAAIVSGLVESVFGEMRPPEDDDSPWPDRVRSWVLAYRELTRAHPHLVLQIVTDPAAVDRAAGLISAPLHAALATAGLSSSTIPSAVGMLVDFVHGFALGDPAGGPERPSELVGGAPPDFAVGLDIMIRGLGDRAADERNR